MTASIFLGTQGWSFKSWIGTFYPDHIPAEGFLAEYAKHFRAVEIDSTYYGTPQAETLKQWQAATPPDFRFTAKFPHVITHDKMLHGADRDTAHFLASMQLLGDKLGPLVLQFSYQFKPDRHSDLANFLSALPGDFRYAVEIRHRGWLNDAFFDLLNRHRVALVLTDNASMPRVDRATTDFAYIRWLGKRKDVPGNKYQQVRIKRDNELDNWSQVVARLVGQGVSIWGFANNRYQGHSPATIRALMERLGLQQTIPARIEAPKTTGEKERRTVPRVDATYKIAYECFNNQGIKVDEGPAKTVDISGRGALIEIPRGARLDDSMVLLVMAPFHMLMVKGNVVHSRLSQNGTYHVGVRLTEVVEGSWDLLDWVIRERMAEKSEWL